jgi:hypothetical protein
MADAELVAKSGDAPKTKRMLILTSALLLLAACATGAATLSKSPVAYTDDGKLIRPAYETWPVLSETIDLGDQPVPAWMEHPKIFGKVLVNPEALKSYMKSGKWPDKTVFISLPNVPENISSPDNPGRVEVHIKDRANLGPGWVYFTVKKGQPAARIAPTVACYTCHADHAAEDTVFTQYYPLLRERHRK